MSQRSKMFSITYESYGINGEEPEGDFINVIVIAGNIEDAIHKLRSHLPKSLEYAIRNVENEDYEVIL